MPHRLLFMGSDPIALPTLEAVDEGQCGAIEWAGVFTQPDRPRGRGKKVTPNEIKLWAQERGLPVHQPERLGKEQRLQIAEMEIDAILVMAYGHLLSQRLIDTPPRGILNLHTSLLPRYRGASPIQGAVASGEEKTGVTLMRMVKRMDAGPIIDQESVPIARLDRALEVERRLSLACPVLLQRNLLAVLEGRATCREQDESEATYVGKLSKGDGVLDFAAPAKALAHRINGLFPWPGTRVRVGQDFVRLGQADYQQTPTRQAEPGTILPSDERGARVACGEGVLLLKQLQRPGGKMLPASDFLRGYPWPVGERLPSEAMTQLVRETAPSG